MTEPHALSPSQSSFLLLLSLKLRGGRMTILTPSESSSVFTSRQSDTKGFTSLLGKLPTLDLFTPLRGPYLQNPLALITIITSYLSFVSGPAELWKLEILTTRPPGTSISSPFFLFFSYCWSFVSEQFPLCLLHFIFISFLWARKISPDILW